MMSWARLSLSVLCVVLCVVWSCVLCGGMPTREAHVSGARGADRRAPFDPASLSTDELAQHRRVALKLATSRVHTNQHQTHSQQPTFIAPHHHANVPLSTTQSQPMFDLSAGSSGMSDVSGSGVVWSASPTGVAGISVVSDSVRGWCLQRLRSSPSASVVVLSPPASGPSASPSIIRLPQSYSKVLWVNPSDRTNFPQIMSAVDVSPSSEVSAHFLQINPTGELYAAHNTGPTQSTRYLVSDASAGPVPLGVWTHVAVTYDHPTGTLSLYRNGVLTAQHTPTSADTTWQSWTGSRNTTLFNKDSTYSYAGCVDRVQVYQGALTQTQVQQIMQQTSPGTGTTTRTPTTATATTTAPTTMAPTASSTTTPPTPSPTPTPTPSLSGGPPTMLPTQPAPSSPNPTPVTYHSGSVMTGGASVYLIFYGNWSALDPVALSLIPEFVSNLGGSALWNSATSYYQVNSDGSKTYIPNLLAYKGYANDNYSYGTQVSDAAIYYIIKNALASGALASGSTAVDPNGIYLVLTSPDVNLSSGLCTSYCGWHTASSLGGRKLRYAAIGSSIRCGGCLTPGTPNNARNADSMISVIFHELMETATDPDFTAWYDTNSYENGDRCAWNFGTTWVSANGQPANIHLGQRDYLVQTNWVNSAGGYCVNHW